MQPLTHHEIMALVEPFTRRGRHVDLPASDRLERRLAFKPVDHAGPDAGAPPLRERLLLEPFGSGQFRLTRTLDHANGLQASLRTVGADLSELLAGIEAVAPWSQFRFGEGCAIAFTQRLGPGVGGPLAQVVLMQGVVQLPGLRLTMQVSSVGNVPGEITIASTGPGAPELPQDLLAVLGWDWARLIREHHGWRSRLKLPRREPERSTDALAKLERTAQHLVRTLAAPPAQFHPRHRAARWGVVLRRSIPVLTLVMLALGLVVLSRFAAGRETGAWVLLIHVPTLMLAISFRMQELAQFEIPPLPRPLRAAAWVGAQGSV